MSLAGGSGKQNREPGCFDHETDGPVCDGSLYEISPAPGTGERPEGGGKGKGKYSAWKADREGTDRAESGRIQYGYRENGSARV